MCVTFFVLVGAISFRMALSSSKICSSNAFVSSNISFLSVV
nr:MAG TPA: hypothetical protein [Bacteriophage sp.]